MGLPVEVPLRNGGVALIDQIDAPRVLARSWSKVTPTKGYNYAKASKNAEKMHRFLMGLQAGDGLVVDHVDGNGLNNCRANLRVCSPAENARNRRRCNSSSGYKGVFQENTGFAVRIGGEYLGYFKSKHVAALVYNDTAQKRFGEFAALNVVDAHACRADLGILLGAARADVAFLEGLLAQVASE